MQMRVWSMFTGAGGLDLGLAEVGVVPELAVELVPVFCRTLEMNLDKTRVVRADIKNVFGAQLFDMMGPGEVDLMVGGPPCQSFSTGGGRAGLRDPRGNLIFEYLRLVREVQPRAFVLENVANLVTAALRHRPIADRPGRNWNLAAYSSPQKPPRTTLPGDFAEPMEWEELSGSAIVYLIEQLFSVLDYRISFGILDAADFGAAQHRLRFVMIGVRDGKAPALPQPTHGEGLRPLRVLKDVIGDLETNPGPGSEYTPTVKRVFDLVPEGGNWRSLPVDVARAAMGERSFAAGGGKTGFYRRLAWDRPAPTITGRSNRKGSAMCHPSQSRPLSVRECARVQGFPDTWSMAGSVSDQYMQIGNAVPVALGAAVARTVVENLDGGGDVETRDVPELIASAAARLRASARNKRGSRS